MGGGGGEGTLLPAVGRNCSATCVGTKVVSLLHSMQTRPNTR
jgi:hypothetical protein